MIYLSVQFHGKIFDTVQEFTEMYNYGDFSETRDIGQKFDSNLFKTEPIDDIITKFKENDPTFLRKYKNAIQKVVEEFLEHLYPKEEQKVKSTANVTPDHRRTHSSFYEGGSEDEDDSKNQS